LKLDRATREVLLDDGQEFGLNPHAAFFSAFTFDVDDRGAVVGGADVADVGLTGLVCAEAGPRVW
jgi:hypothetical protein